MRLEIEGEGFGLARDEFDGCLRPAARRHGMDWRVSLHGRPEARGDPGLQYDHCLTDLLWRWEPASWTLRYRS
jgi:formyltetrahydrofolate hydrolase